MRGLATRSLARSFRHPSLVCPSCWLLQHRGFASSKEKKPQQPPSSRVARLKSKRIISAKQKKPQQPPSSGVAHLESKRIISISGPDAAKFLQGLTTADVFGSDGQPLPGGFYTGFLNSQGRVLADAFVYPFTTGIGIPIEESGFFVEVDAAHESALSKHLRKHKLRASVILQGVSYTDAQVYHAWNDKPQFNVQATGDMLVIKDPRAPGMGYRIIQLWKACASVPLPRRPEAAYMLRRILRGVPEGPHEIQFEKALPSDINLDMATGISFGKGCYIGQELVVRTRHCGVVRKRVLPCVLYADGEPVPQKLAYDADFESREKVAVAKIPTKAHISRIGRAGRPSGTWLEGVGNIGLALCRLDHMTDVVLPEEPSTAPYAPSDEFSIEYGGEDAKTLKIKAFVPAWLRRKLDEDRRFRQGA